MFTVKNRILFIIATLLNFSSSHLEAKVKQPSVPAIPSARVTQVDATTSQVMIDEKFSEANGLPPIKFYLNFPSAWHLTTAEKSEKGNNYLKVKRLDEKGEIIQELTISQLRTLANSRVHEHFPILAKQVSEQLLAYLPKGKLLRSEPQFRGSQIRQVMDFQFYLNGKKQNFEEFKKGPYLLKAILMNRVYPLPHGVVIYAKSHKKYLQGEGKNLEKMISSFQFLRPSPEYLPQAQFPIAPAPEGQLIQE